MEHGTVLPTLINHVHKPLTEPQIVDATLEFVNGANVFNYRSAVGSGESAADDVIGNTALEEQILRARKFREMAKEGAVNVFGDLPPKAISKKEDLYSCMRHRMALILEASLAHPMKAAKLVAGYGFRWIEGFNFETFGTKLLLRDSRKGYELMNYYEFRNLPELLHLGMLFILDGHKDFRDNLCKCRWEPCGRFFISVKPKTGRPKRFFCQPDCMRKSHDQDAPKRKRKR